MAPTAVYRVDAPKKRTNVSVNEDLVRIAKAYGLNVSGITEAALAEAVRRRAAQEWRAENAAAISAYNRRVESRGTFSDSLRRF